MVYHITIKHIYELIHVVEGIKIIVKEETNGL